MCKVLWSDTDVSIYNPCKYSAQDFQWGHGYYNILIDLSGLTFSDAHGREDHIVIVELEVRLLFSPLLSVIGAFMLWSHSI